MGTEGAGMDEKEFRSWIKDVTDRLDRIEHGIFGDEKIGTDGLVKRLKAVERDIEDLDGKMSRFLWMATGAAGGATGLVQWITKVMQ